MAIPLELRAFITAQGLEVFSQIQGGMSQVTAAAQQAASAGLGQLSSELAPLLPMIGGDLQLAIGGTVSAMRTMANEAGGITPAALNELAMSLDRTRAAFIQSVPGYQEMIRQGLAYRTIIGELTPAQQALVAILESTINSIHGLSLSMKQAMQSAVGLEKQEKKTGAATRYLGREARATALTGMNVMSSATQGVMMAMGLLQGSIMSVGFGLIFLRYSIAPITLGVAALIAAIGGTIKAISFVGPAFEELVTGPMARMKAAVVEAMGYLSGAVWVRIIIPSIRILADLAERFRDLAREMWLTVDVQRAWGELIALVQGLFQHLSSVIKEHGGLLKWLVRTGFIVMINVLKGLVRVGKFLIDVLIAGTAVWRLLSSALKPVFDGLRRILSIAKEVGANLAKFLAPVKGFILNKLLPAGKALAEGLPEKFKELWEKSRPHIVALAEGLEENLSKLWENSKPYVEAFASGFSAALEPVIGWLIDSLPILSTEISNLGSVMATWKETVRPFADWFKEVLGGWILAELETFGATVAGAIAGAVVAFRGLLSVAINTATYTIASLIALTNAFNAFFLTIDLLRKGDLESAKATMNASVLAYGVFKDTIAMAQRELSAGTFEAGAEAGQAAVEASGRFRQTFRGRLGVEEPTISITVTGNNFYGNPDEATIRRWSQLFNAQTMGRLTNRYGIGLGGN